MRIITLTLTLTILFVLSFPISSLALETKTITQIKLGPQAWAMNPKIGHRAEQPFALASGGMAFHFPVSPLPDPDATGPWSEYLVRKWTKPIPHSGIISVTFRIVSTEYPVFNYKSEKENHCDAPPTFRFYIQNGPLYNGAEMKRWWANPVSFSLVEGLSGECITMSVSLEPSQWSNTFSHQGDSNRDAENGFYDTLNHPTWIGFTFGGGCFFGHGVNVSHGTAQFEIIDFHYESQNE